MSQAEAPKVLPWGPHKPAREAGEGLGRRALSPRQRRGLVRTEAVGGAGAGAWRLGMIRPGEWTRA